MERFIQCGQDKKNYWTNIASASCQNTGNVLAINGEKVKGEKLHHETHREIVLFGSNAEVISRTESILEVPWQHVRSKDSKSGTSENGTKLDFLAILYKQNTSKKNNPNGDKNQILIEAIVSDGKFVYQHTYDLPFEFTTIDTLITLPDYRIVVIGGAKGMLNKFIIQSSPTDKTISIHKFNKKDPTYVFKAYIDTDSMDYVVFSITNFKSKTEDAYYLFPLIGGKFYDPIILENKIEGKSAADFQVLCNDDDLLLVQTIEVVKGLNKFKDGFPVPTQYKITGIKMNKISGYDIDSRVLQPSNFRYTAKLVKSSSGYYFISKNFVPNPKKDDEFLIQNRLTKLTL